MSLHIYVETDDGPKEITEGVQALYDLVIQSMDWGSGFLSEEDAVPVAELAELCGFKGAEEAQRYLVEYRRSQRESELRRLLRNGRNLTDEEWRSATEQAAAEIGCQSVRVHRSTVHGETRTTHWHCQLPEGHEGQHLNGSQRWVDE